jgi:hypothetical protein
VKGTPLRLPRFRLRTLMILVAVLAVIFMLLRSVNLFVGFYISMGIMVSYWAMRESAETRSM